MQDCFPGSFFLPGLDCLQFKHFVTSCTMTNFILLLKFLVTLIKIIWVISNLLVEESFMSHWNKVLITYCKIPKTCSFRYFMATLQSLTGSVQGQNRDFPVYFSQQGKTCFHYRNPSYWKQVFPCVEILHREIPVLALYWPCKGLQCAN